VVTHYHGAPGNRRAFLVRRIHPVDTSPWPFAQRPLGCGSGLW